MEPILLGLSAWLHSLATVVLIGFFVISSLIFVPLVGDEAIRESGKIAISEISRRSRRWMYLSLAVFVLTGVYLMLADENYRGLGEFSNLWAVLMLIKHILVLAMIAMGFLFNAVFRVGPMLKAKSGADQAMSRYRLYSHLMAISGVLVLLLTALAQVE